VIEDLNRRLPPGAKVDFLSDLTKTAVGVFLDRQNLGILRGDIVLGAEERDPFPYVWLLAQDSKAIAFTRLLFAMQPWYASEPRQLDGARVATVVDPVAVSRAYALRILLDAPDRSQPDPTGGAGLGPGSRTVARPSLGRRTEKGPTAHPE